MKKKLFTYELRYYLSGLMKWYLALLAAAVLGWIVGLFENTSDLYAAIRKASVFLLAAAGLGVLAATTVLAVKRYYTQLFTSRAYLTLSLPVAPQNHILVKLGAALVANAAGLAAIFAAVCVFTAGPWLVEIGKAAVYLLKMLTEKTEGHFLFFLLEAILVLLAAQAAWFLMLYMCLSIGQRSRENRRAAAARAGFVILAVFGSIALVLCVLHGSGVLAGVERKFTQMPLEEWLTAGHIVNLEAWLICVLLCLVEFMVSEYILDEKLDLE